jgi:hypothetical protein
MNDAGFGHIEVGEAVAASVVGVAELAVIEPEGVQQGCLEVVNKNYWCQSTIDVSSVFPGN